MSTALVLARARGGLMLGFEPFSIVVTSAATVVDFLTFHRSRPRKRSSRVCTEEGWLEDGDCRDCYYDETT